MSILVSFSVSAIGVNEEFDLNEINSNPVVIVSDFQTPTGSGVLYDNGSLVNGTGTGAGGLDESILQTASLGMDTIGAGHQLSAGNRIADDFTVTGSDWTIDNIIFYAYQTGETASTITAVNLQIWDGVPGAMGSSVVFGDDTTNRMSSTANSNILRVTEATTGTNTDRQIAASTVDVNITLPAGTYWLDWQSDGSGGSGPWAPPITISGQTVTGNALQSIGGVWSDLLDGGTNTQQGFPFIIQGTNIVLAPPVPVPFLNSWTLILLALVLIALSFRMFKAKN